MPAIDAMCYSGLTATRLPMYHAPVWPCPGHRLRIVIEGRDRWWSAADGTLVGLQTGRGWHAAGIRSTTVASGARSRRAACGNADRAQQDIRRFCCPDHGGDAHMPAPHRSSGHRPVQPLGPRDPPAAIRRPFPHCTIPPAPVAQMCDPPQIRSLALFAPRSRPTEPDGIRNLIPVDRSEPAVFGADRHPDSMNHSRVAAKEKIRFVCVSFDLCSTTGSRFRAYARSANGASGENERHGPDRAPAQGHRHADH